MRSSRMASWGGAGGSHRETVIERAPLALASGAREFTYGSGRSPFSNATRRVIAEERASAGAKLDAPAGQIHDWRKETLERAASAAAEVAEQCEHDNDNKNDPENRHFSPFVCVRSFLLGNAARTKRDAQRRGTANQSSLC